MRYSLADYILTVAIPPSVASEFGLDTISIGGEGSYVGSIDIDKPTSLYSTEGDSTGSWIHNKNLNKTGSVSVSLNQLAPQVEQLKNLFKIYEKSSTISEGLTLQLTNEEETIAVCTDCYIQRVPTQSFGPTAQTQTWSFTCGRIDYD